MVASCVHTEVTRLSPASASLVAQRAEIELSAPISLRVTSAYALFIPIGGGVEPASVVAQLRAAALALGADDVVNIETSTSCQQGVGVLRQFLGWITTNARGTAVRYRRPAPTAPPLAMVPSMVPSMVPAMVPAWLPVVPQSL